MKLKYNESCPDCNRRCISTGSSIKSVRFKCPAGHVHHVLKTSYVAPQPKTVTNPTPGWYRNIHTEPLTVRTYDLYATARLAVLGR